MGSETEVSGILRHYPDITVRGVVALGGAGGFSGARLWRVASSNSPMCLRRWPQDHPNNERLNYIHAVLHHVAANGLSILPLPRKSRDRRTFIVDRDFRWQLEPWMPGEADYHAEPNEQKLSSAMRSLAAFHRAAESFQLQSGPAPGLLLRREQLAQLSSVRVDEFRLQLDHVGWPEFAARGEPILQCVCGKVHDAREAVEVGLRTHGPIQPCIRDIWHDHVLFHGNEVSGLVDFGALNMDHVAADISRLLGSLVGDDPKLRELGITEYQTVKKLAAADLMLIEAYDRASTLLAGMNWLRWICIDRRVFEDRSQVLRRLDEILARLLPRM